MYMMHKKLVFVYVLYFLITPSLIPCSETLYPTSSLKIKLPRKDEAEEKLKNLGYKELVEHSDLIEKMYEKKLSPLQFATVVRQSYFQHDEYFHLPLMTPEEQKFRNNHRNYLFYLILNRSDALGELYSLGLYRPIILKYK